MMAVMSYVLYFYLFLLTSADTNLPMIIETEPKLIEMLPNTERTTTANTRKIDEKYFKSVLLKMLNIARSSNKSISHLNSDNKTVDIKTEENKETTDRTEQVIRNKPQRYIGNNGAISRMCPYFVADGGFNIEKMESAYWPRFHNMNESLKCFKIEVLKLSEKQMEENEMAFGTFGGKVDWGQCQFEIKSPEPDSNRRHFLLGSVSDMGVMRNILITTNANGESSLAEESPDQWMMLKKLVLLRDCKTGDVMVFARSLHQTTTAEVTEALEELGEEMKGQMVCDEDDDWLPDV